ncbi:MAG: CAP domain-containing protein [Bacteroidota bacterium]
MIYRCLILALITVFAPATQNQIAQEVHARVNQYRKAQGLSPLKAKKELNAIAFRHSQAMAAGKVPFSHQGFDQRVEEVKAYAKKDWRVAENLYASYYRQDIGRLALKDWRESPGHKENLEGRFIFTGIGVARSAKGEIFITQLYVGRR